jgi:hypothetical protein
MLVFSKLYFINFFHLYNAIAGWYFVTKLYFSHAGDSGFVFSYFL